MPCRMAKLLRNTAGPDPLQLNVMKLIVDVFCNPKREHMNNGMLSPVNFEIKQRKLNTADVWETGDASELNDRLIVSVIWPCTSFSCLRFRGGPKAHRRSHGLRLQLSRLGC